MTAPNPLPHTQRSQLAAPVVLVYWLMLLGGLVLFTVIRVDDLTVDVTVIIPLWIGAIGGTLLGQYLAMQDLRFWLTALIIGATAMYCEPLLPGGHGTAELWRAFVPAALCGFWSLGDRAVLAAAWFPGVLWMLTVLDRHQPRLAPDGVAAVLLGGFAVLFVAFLRTRESRRVALWHRISPEALAPIAPVELLREPPGRQLARAAWAVSIGAITIALTVWIAPPLWQLETLVGEAVQIDPPSEGLPCCPQRRIEPTESARVKEYLDLGLGHDVHAASPDDGDDQVGCRVCSGAPIGAATGELAVSDTPDPVIGEPGPVTGPPTVASGGDAEIAGLGAAGTYAAGTDPGPPIETNAPPEAPTEPDSPAWTDQGAPAAATVGEPPVPAVATARQEPPPPPMLIPPAPRTRAPVPAVAPPPTAGAATSPSRTAATAEPGAPHRSAGDAAGASVLRWLVLVLVAALVLQVVRLALRPLRRLVTLRHLRRPFWRETIDQQVSNSWQLALIGLRDAGWRAGATEAPHQLARRAGVDGLDRCAEILERARHGVGLDDGDIADMQTSADAAYRAARTGIGGFARATGWLRWPLT